MQESFADADNRANMAVEYAETYASEASKFAKYPKDRAELYLSMGLAGETGELFGALMDTAEMPRRLVAELGDVMWYAVALAQHFNLNVKETMRDALATYTDVEGPPSLVSSAAIIAIHAGSIIEAQKKLLRGDPLTHSDVRRRAGLSLTMIFLAAHAISERLNTSLLDVMQLNIEKLSGRDCRGTLLGDGDER